MRRASRREERGAVAMMVALVTVAVLLPIAAMGVDLGMQRVARRDMQAVADMVALDMARHLDGRKYARIKEANAWESGIRDAIARNLNLSPERQAELLTGGTKIVITTEGVTSVARMDGQFLPGRDHLEVRVTMGRLDPTNGEFEEVTVLPHQIPSAVRVVTSTAVDFAFSSRRGGATRTAIATADPLACHRIGSWGADVRTSHSVLDGALRSVDANIDLQAVHYEALAKAQVTLGELAAELSTGTPTQMFAASVTLAKFLEAVVEVLPADSPAIEVLDARIIDVVSVGLMAKTVQLGEIASIGGDPDLAMAANVNVLDLVQGALLAANGDNAIAMPGLTVTVPGLTDVEVAAHVVQRPQVACGFGSTAQTSQISVDLTGELVETSLGLLQPSLGGTVGVRARVADASATLDSVICTTAGPQSMTVIMPPPSLATLDLRLDLEIIGLPLAETSVSSAAPGPTGTHVLTLPSAYDSPVTPQGSGSLGLPPTDQVKASLLGLPLGLLLDPVLLALQPVLQALETALLDQVLPQLGITVAGADLYGVRTPDCVAPNLRG